LAAAAAVVLADLPLHVITAVTLRLDLPADRLRLEQTLRALKPVLLVLDPFIRLHQRDENDASHMAPLLGFLRQLQRQFHLAVVLVHHAKKDGGSLRPCQASRVPANYTAGAAPRICLMAIPILGQRLSYHWC
jgi:hypothetical protein